MKQSGHLDLDIKLNRIMLIEIVKKKIRSVDFERARMDVENLLKEEMS